MKLNLPEKLLGIASDLRKINLDNHLKSNYDMPFWYNPKLFINNEQIICLIPSTLTVISNSYEDKILFSISKERFAIETRAIRKMVENEDCLEIVEGDRKEIFRNIEHAQIFLNYMKKNALIVLKSSRLPGEKTHA